VKRFNFFVVVYLIYAMYTLKNWNWITITGLLFGISFILLNLFIMMGLASIIIYKFLKRKESKKAKYCTQNKRTDTIGYITRLICCIDILSLTNEINT